MRFKSLRRRRTDHKDVDEMLVEAAYRGLLNKEPDSQGFQFCLSSLKKGVSWDKFLRGILSWHEFVPPIETSSTRVFDLLIREKDSLERIDADLTIELSEEVGSAGKLRLRGPMRDTSVFSSIIHAGGMWEPNVTHFLTRCLEAGHVFVDVGANLGYFTILGGARVGPEGRVVSFEPAGSNLEYLRRNVEINRLSNVQVVPCALWSKRATLSMAVQEDFLGGAHLMESVAGSAGADVHPVDAPPNRNRDEVAVCAPLDELISSGEVELSACRLMKIDIEGSEPHALDGMRGTLAAQRPALLIEVNPHCLALLNLGPEAIWDRLVDLDYSIGVLPQPHQTPVLDRFPRFSLAGQGRQFESFSQMQEALAELGAEVPAWLDLVALPKQWDHT